LVAAGRDVLGVDRSGAGATIVAAVATDGSTTRVIAAGAAAVYFCLNAVHHDRWPQEFPPLQRGVLAAVEAAGARLVVLHNLYAYGPTHGADLVETMPAHPGAPLTLAGIVRPALREYSHTLYQFTGRWVVDDSRFRAAFGVGATPLDEAVAATVDWYERRSAAAAVPTHVDRAADAGKVQRHAQQACGDEYGGGDHGNAQVEQLEEQRESE
jgi:hypothetical protein